MSNEENQIVKLSDGKEYEVGVMFWSGWKLTKRLILQVFADVALKETLLAVIDSIQNGNEKEEFDWRIVSESLPSLIMAVSNTVDDNILELVSYSIKGENKINPNNANIPFQDAIALREAFLLQNDIWEMLKIEGKSLMRVLPKEQRKVLEEVFATGATSLKDAGSLDGKVSLQPATGGVREPITS